MTEGFAPQGTQPVMTVKPNILRVSEVYPSVQGEGPNVGRPTVFIRFGGCNLRCPLWPCDTQHAIDPKYRAEWSKLTPAQVRDIATGTHWGSRVDFCLTGGEPFLQQHEALKGLVFELLNHGTVECFSNGTIGYPGWAVNRVSFVMDWKLPGSGEDSYNETRIENFDRLIMSDMAEEHSIKFTIADRFDYDEAKHLYWSYRMAVRWPGKVYAGVVWGQLENAELVEWIMHDQLPWYLNVQVHNHIWDRTQRGI